MQLVLCFFNLVYYCMCFTHCISRAVVILGTLCACGTPFSVDHVLSCPKRGLPSLRQNEIRDLTATLLTGVCSQVCTELPVHNPDEFHLSTSNTQERDLILAYE